MKKVIGIVSLSMLPFLAFAQVTDASSVITLVGNLLNQIVPLLLGLATVWLIWNLFQYIQAGTGDIKAREAARDSILLAIVLLFVMVSIWGLVGVLKNTFGLSDTTIPDVKVFKGN